MHPQKRPASLKKGDRIGLISTARKISGEELEPALKVLHSWGLKPVLGENLFRQWDQFAGTDEERTADLQSMLDDPQIKAVLCARGGYGTVRILDRLNWSAFVKNPKWLIGYSDVTVLHCHINGVLGLPSIHATMPLNFATNTPESLESLRTALFGQPLVHEFKPLFVRPGEGKAVLTGGNLSILCSLLGSPEMQGLQGKLLFLEDLDEYLYHIDRMMMALKRSGALKDLAGLLVGGMTDMKDNTVPFGRSAEEIIRNAVQDYRYPVAFGVPAGHLSDNRALPMGVEVSFNITESLCRLDFRAGAND